MEEKLISMIDKLPDLFNELSAKLGIASGKMWEWALLQVKVEIVQSIVLVIITGLLFLAYLKYFSWVIKKDKEDYAWDGFGHYVALGVFGVALAILIIFTLVSIYNIPALIINLEFSAFKIIVEQLSLLVK